MFYGDIYIVNHPREDDKEVEFELIAVAVTIVKVFVAVFGQMEAERWQLQRERSACKAGILTRPE